MAKSKGSAGRIPQQRRAGDYSDWISNPYNEARGWGAWVIAPNGQLLENTKITGVISNPSVNAEDWSYHEQAFRTIGERDGWGRALQGSLYDEAERRGFTRVRLWDFGINSTISISMDRDPSDTLRRAKRILNKLADNGVGIFKPNVKVDLAYAGGYYNGPAANLLTSDSWYEANQWRK